MLYRIGTAAEILRIEKLLPARVLTEVFQGLYILDAEYGSDRNYLESGGYTLVAETKEDVAELKAIIDYDRHPCEWATRIGRDTGYLSALYLMNNDFGVMVYMPIVIAPDSILQDLED